jgi:hypothetical protein
LSNTDPNDNPTPNPDKRTKSPGFKEENFKYSDKVIGIEAEPVFPNFEIVSVICE